MSFPASIRTLGGSFPCSINDLVFSYTVQPGDVGADTVVVNVGTTYDAATGALLADVDPNASAKIVTPTPHGELSRAREIR